MQTTQGVLLLMLLSATLSWSASQDRPADKFSALLARLTQGDITVDFVELRRAFADSPLYTDGSDPDERKAMFNALNKKEFDQALAHARKILEENYLDIDAHQVAYVAQRELHAPAEAEFHKRIALGLIQAIFKTGDGKSTETAWEVLSTHEEYVVLRALGLRPGSQALLQSGRHSYDKLDAIDGKSGEKVTLYFNIDKPMGYLDRIISKSK